MRLNQLLTHSSTLNLNARQLLDKKNQDYSSEDNVHANFDETSILCALLGVDVTTPEGCAEFEIVKKVRRYFKIIHSKKPAANESLRDSTIDLHNYIDLLYTMVIDNDQK